MIGKDFAKAGIIEPAALAALLESADRPAVKVLDCTFVLPGNPPPAEIFQKKRIGDAAFFDIEAIADKKSPLPHMLPSPEEFAAAVSALGIGNDDLVVTYGQNDMVMGPARAWWMFRVFGHENVTVLNGGLPAWKAENLPVNTQAPTAPKPSQFTAQFNAALVRDIEAVQAASDGGSACILDARPPGRFTGTEKEPRPGMRSGHIPGSHNVPAKSLVDPETGKLRTPKELKDIFVPHIADSSKPLLASCGSGVTACVIALALYHIGKPQCAVYDGSWSEWGQESANTMVEIS